MLRECLFLSLRGNNVKDMLCYPRFNTHIENLAHYAHFFNSLFEACPQGSPQR